MMMTAVAIGSPHVVGDGGQAASDPLVRAMLELAIRYRPPASELRVLVGNNLRLAQPYLAARAQVVGTGAESAPDPRFHSTLDPDPHGLPTPRRDHSFDLVLVSYFDAASLTARLDAIATAIAPGGVAIIAAPAVETSPVVTAIASTDLELSEHRRVALTPTGRFELVVASDPRPRLRIPGITLDRSACVDRHRIRHAMARDPWQGATPSSATGSVSSLLQVLRQTLERGDEPDVRAMPWPGPPPGPTAPAAPNGDVLVVMPHPDDETIYAGATLAGLVQAGRTVRLIVATNGAGGRGSGALAARRAQELLAASQILGIQGVSCLGWDDFGKYRDPARTEPVTAGDALRTWGLDRALADLVTEIRRHRPALVLGLDPEIDPNASLHGHHLGLGILLAVAYHAAADPQQWPERGPAWSCDEHRVMAPPSPACGGDRLEIDRPRQQQALRAHASQAYSTARQIEGLDDPTEAAVEVSRRVQYRRAGAWVLVRRHSTLPPKAIAWESEAARIRGKARPRAAIVRALRHQDNGQDFDPAIEASLKRLQQPQSVAVVTGQQVGLLGGPAYTIAKALGAIALARRLQHRGIEAVPLFWLASQDHDLAEVQQIPRLGAASLHAEQPDHGCPVGSLLLGDSITGLLEQWLAEGPRPAPAIEALLRRAYQPSHTLSEAFRTFIRAITRGTGLLLLDPADPALARLAYPLLRRALVDASALDSALERASQRLHASARRPVITPPPGGTQVFGVDPSGRRRRLLYRPGTRQVCPRQLAQLDHAPERSSAAALLRPLVQDQLLPTIAYVAGPTERRYHEQLDEVYRWAQIPKPVVVTRPSIHLLPAGDLHALQYAGGLDALRQSTRPQQTLGRRALDPAQGRWFDEVESLIEIVDRSRNHHRPPPAAALVSGLDRLRGHAEQCTATPSRTRATWSTQHHALGLRLNAVLEHPSARNLTRFGHQLRRLRRSLLRDGRRSRPDAIAAWARVSPSPSPSERRMTVAEWLARGGANLPSIVLDALADDPSAQLHLTIGTPP